MTIWVYTMRKTTPAQTVRGMVYEYRYRANMRTDPLAWRRQESGLDAYTDKMWEFFKEEERDYPWGKGVLVSTRIGDDSPRGGLVHLQTRETFSPVWYDCDRQPGTPVGVLGKEGRRWALVTLEEEYQRVIHKCECYGLTSGTLSERVGQLLKAAKLLWTRFPEINTVEERDAFYAQFPQYQEMMRLAERGDSLSCLGFKEAS